MSIFTPNGIPVTNGDFEQSAALPPVGWQIGGLPGSSASLTYDVTFPYQGVRSLVVNATADLAGVSTINTFPVTPGQVYQLSGALRSISGDVAVLQMWFLDANNQLIKSLDLVTTSFSWVYMTGSLVAPPNAVTAQIDFQMQGPSGGIGSFDVVTLGVVSAATYYVGLLTSQYQNSPKLKAFLQLLAQPFIDTAICATSLGQAFNVETAIGVQLDIIGQWVGVSRTLPFQPSGGVSPVMDDPTYRLILQAQIFKNNWNGQLAPIYSFWSKIFPGGSIIIEDQQNMTALVSLAGSFDSIIVDMINNDLLIPRPEGVQYNITFATLPILGFDLNNAYQAGLDLGHFS